MVKGVKKAHVTTCKKAVCTAPVNGRTKEPKPAPLPEAPHAIPKEEMKGSIPAMAAPATIRTAIHLHPAQKIIYTVAGKKAVMMACRKISLRNLKISRITAPENVTIDSLFSRGGKQN